MGKEEDLIAAVVKRAQESDGRKKLTCTEAFEVAQRVGVEIIEVGRICNQENIKICKCQLGCFR